MDPARLSDHHSFTADKMTPAHWQLFGACIEHDIRIGRELSGLMVGGNFITRILGKFALGYIIRGGERVRERPEGGATRPMISIPENRVILSPTCKQNY